MSELHPVIALHYQEERPSEEDVLACLRKHPITSAVEGDTIAHLAAYTKYTQVIFDGLLANASPGVHRGRVLSAVLAYGSSSWMLPKHGYWEHLEQTYPQWSEELLLPDEEGLCGWDRYLAGNFGVSCAYDLNSDQNALMARVASVLETRHPQAFLAPHPAHPEVSCAQVWAWLWACIPLRLPRMAHWGYLLNCGIDPNFAMEVEGGQMSIGTALLWAMNAEVSLSLSPPSKWKIQPDFCPEPSAEVKWMQYKRPQDEFNEEFPWQALWMLRQAGMDAANLKEPTVWKTPALGLLARRDQGGGQWTSDYFQKIQSRWLGLGLDLGAQSAHDRTLLDIVIAPAQAHAKPDPPLHPLGHWKITSDIWQRAATPQALDRFWASPMCLRLLDDEPVLKRALLERIASSFDAWSGTTEAPNQDIQTLRSHLHAFEVHHPLTPLGDVLAQHIQNQPIDSLIQAVMRFTLFRIQPDVALEDIKAIEARARAFRLAAVFRDSAAATPALRQELARTVLDWALSEPESKEITPPLAPAENAANTEFNELLIGLAEELRDHHAADGTDATPLAQALMDYTTKESAPKKDKLIALPPTSQVQQGKFDAYWGSPQCLALFESNPKLLHALISALIDDFIPWPCDATHENFLGEALTKIECFDTLPALEFMLWDHVRAVAVKTRVCMALRLASTKMETPESVAALKILTLQYRTRPINEDVSNRVASTVAQWVKVITPDQQKEVDPQARDKAAIRAEKDRAPEDDRAIVMLYTEKALEEFGVWSSTRCGNSETLRACRARLVADKPDQKARLDDPRFQRHRTRRLSLAKPALDAMAELRIGFPHFEDVIKQIQDHLSLAMRGDGSFSLPPLLMAGPPGTGKTFFFQELAAKVATTYRLLNMESITAGFSIVGLDYGYGDANPGIVFDTLMADGATANPIVLLDEIDKVTTDSSHPVAPVLLSLLEPHSARIFADRCFPLTMDVSRINWVATANYLERVDAPLLSRFNVVHVANPDYNARRAMSQHIYKALRNTYSWGASFEETLLEETIQVLARPANAARDLRKNLTTALATAARANRGQLLPEDVPPNRAPVPLSPWDAPLPEIPMQQPASDLIGATP